MSPQVSTRFGKPQRTSGHKLLEMSHPPPVQQRVNSRVEDVGHSVDKQPCVLPGGPERPVHGSCVLVEQGGGVVGRVDQGQALGVQVGQVYCHAQGWDVEDHVCEGYGQDCD